MPVGAVAQAEIPGGAGASSAARDATTGQVVNTELDKIGRNDPCWCGSDKKFKLCHGR